MKYRRSILFSLLLVTSVAALVAPDPSTQLVEIVARTDAPNTTIEPAQALVKKRNDLSAPLILFSTPPVIAPAVVPPPPPPPPQAPPLPFRVLGRYTDQKGGYVLLANDQRGIAVRLGDVIDGAYEVKAIEGSSMTLIYLPLRQAQILDIGMPLSLMN